MERSDSSCTSRRITIDARIGVASELAMDSRWPSAQTTLTLATAHAQHSAASDSIMIARDADELFDEEDGKEMNKIGPKAGECTQPEGLSQKGFVILEIIINALQDQHIHIATHALALDHLML